MSITTVRPDATVGLGGATVTGAANAHTATSDDSDSSYIEFDAVGDAPGLNFAEPSIPGTAVLKEVRVRTRSAKIGFVAGYPTLQIANFDGAQVQRGVTWSTPTTTTVGVFAPDDFNLAGVFLGLEKLSGDPALRIYELYCDFVYVARPAVTVAQPVGIVAETNLPTVTWINTYDSDGLHPTRYEVKVFDAATYGDFAGVVPDISTPFTGSGQVASTATSYQIEELLPNDDYRAYVRVAQTVNGELHWSEWDFEAFTIDAPAPGVPTLALVPQPACGRMRIDLDPRDQLCSNPEAETDTAGWTNVGSSPFERVTSLPTVVGLPTGVTTGLHCVTDIDAEGAFDEVAVESGKTYRFSVYAYLDSTTATGIALQVRNPGGVVKATSATFSTLDSWGRIDVSVTADATETWQFRVRQRDAGGADFYFTAVLIEQAVTLGEYFKETTDAFQVQRSDDAGATWADIRTVDGGGRRERSSNPLTTLLDWEAPNGATVTYRARAVHSFAEGDTFSGWVTDSDSWESLDAWLKHPTDPTLNQIVSVYSQPGHDRSPRRGEFQPLGRSDVIVVSDRRAPERGELVFDLTTVAEQEALDALLDSLAPLLLQMPPGHHWPDRWVRFGDQGRRRIVDKLEVEDTHDTLSWVKVKRPGGNLLAWPNPVCP